jgi:DAACS family dicarboxylate/amino acid:cation (Na+ or H+) symporter
MYLRILIGLVLGVAIGAYVNMTYGTREEVQWVVTNVTEPLGRVWLNALLLVIIPFVLSTLSLSIARMGSLVQFGRIAGLTAVVFVALMALAAVLGVALAGVLRPGAGFDATARQELLATYQGESSQATGLASGSVSTDTFVNLVPRNPVQAMANGDMPGVIIIALMIGVALAQLTTVRAEAMLTFLESLSHVSMRAVELVMVLAPVAAALLIFGIVFRLGPDVLVSLGWFMTTVLAGLAMLMFVIYPLVVSVLSRRRAAVFFRAGRVAMLTALATSSSAATLPMTLKATEDGLNVPNPIAAFAVPLGATLHMTGTALWTAVAVLFITQVFGIDLTARAQVTVALMAVVTAAIAPSVPGGVTPLLTLVLGMVGAPMESVALVIGVDRVLDTCRTAVNVGGNMVAATVVHRYAGVNDGAAL